MLCYVLYTLHRDRERWVSILHYVLYTLHRDREWWVSILHYVLYTLHRDRERWVSILHYVLYTLDRDKDREPLFSIVPIPVPVLVPVPVPCSVYELLEGKGFWFRVNKVESFFYVSQKSFGIYKTLFAPNVWVCVKLQGWVLWQQVIVSTLNVCIIKNKAAKIKEERKRIRCVLMDFYDAFASMSLSQFNIASNSNAEKGSETILCVNVCIAIDVIVKHRWIEISQK